MQRKPVILIVTSADEYGCISQVVAEAVRKEGTHNVVVLDESRYASRFANTRIGGFLIRAAQPVFRLAGKARAAVALRLKKTPSESKRVSGRNRRLFNAVKRYAPEFALTVTPYALAVMSEARRKTGFETQIVHLADAFSPALEDFDVSSADAYIVENSDLKDELVSKGVPARHVMVMGLPFGTEKVSDEECAAAKKKMGLPETPTVFVNATAKDGACEIMSLLLDQGKIVNEVFYAEDTSLMSSLRSRSDSATGRGNVAIVSRKEQFEEFLRVSDFVITRYDPSVIYKCFRLGKPVIAFAADKKGEEDLAYLEEQKSVMFARKHIDIVTCVYELLHKTVSEQYAAKGKAATEMYSAENLASYLTSFKEM